MPNESDKVNDRPDVPGERSIAQKWMDILRKTEFNEPYFSDADQHYFEALRTQVFDSVTRHSLFAIRRVRGTGYQAFLHAQRNAGPVSSECSAIVADSFLDVVRGFRERSTSRLEDETICLGILMGVDIGPLRNVKCMDWKIKDVLKGLLPNGPREDNFREAESVLKKRIEESPGMLENVEDGRVRDFVAGLASGVISSWVMEPLELRHCLDACHEQRMMVLLMSIGAPQQSIIFWNGPRLRFKGWGWAPFSMLDNNLDFPLIISRRGKIRPGTGIEVRYPGFRLRGSIYQGLDSAEEIPTALMEGRVIPDVELVIHTVGEDQVEGDYPWRKSWQHIKFSDCLLLPSLDLQSSQMYLRYNTDGWAHLEQSQRLSRITSAVDL